MLAASPLSANLLVLFNAFWLLDNRYNLNKESVDKMLDFLNPLLNRHPERIKADVEIYTWATCPYCIRAKLLLWWKGVKFTEYKIDGDEAAREQMAQRADGKRSVPQIFVNEQHLGGCDDLYELDGKGGLDPLLVQSPS